jgi:hypothetical protein
MGMKDDQSIAELLKVANDDCEYSGWVNLAQGALDVIEERDAQLRGGMSEQLEKALKDNPLLVHDIVRAGCRYYGTGFKHGDLTVSPDAWELIVRFTIEYLKDLEREPRVRSHD